MPDLYRLVKKFAEDRLAERGFKSDKLKEGFYFDFSEEVSAFFHVTGMWSHVEIHSGVRFAALNDLLYRCALEAGWTKEAASLFRLKLVGIFREKMGDFCAAAEDIGIYCPLNSQVLGAEEILDRILSESVRLSDFTDLRVAVNYVRQNGLFEPFARYMIPAAARIVGDSSLWDWSMAHFANNTEDDKEFYRPLLACLEKA